MHLRCIAEVYQLVIDPHLRDAALRRERGNYLHILTRSNFIKILTDPIYPKLEEKYIVHNLKYYIVATNRDVDKTEKRF